MALPQSVAASSKSIVLIASVLVIAALYFGRQIFIPLALAFVFGFLLTPAVALLEKIRIGRVPSVLTVMLLSFALAGTVSWAVARQLVEIIDELPSYKANLDAKIKSLHASKSGTLSKAAATVQELNKELAALPAEISSAHGLEKETRAERATKPISVQVAAPASNFLEDLRELLGPHASPT